MRWSTFSPQGRSPPEPPRRVNRASGPGAISAAACGCSPFPASVGEDRPGGDFRPVPTPPEHLLPAAILPPTASLGAQPAFGRSHRVDFHAEGPGPAKERGRGGRRPNIQEIQNDGGGESSSRSGPIDQKNAGSIQGNQSGVLGRPSSPAGRMAGKGDAALTPGQPGRCRATGSRIRFPPGPMSGG